MARGHGRRQQPHDRHGEAERRRRAQERRSAQHTEASVEPPFQLPINTEFESSVRLSLEQGLLDSLDQALDSGPERFLAFASSMAQEMSEPTNALVASERNPDLPSLEEFIHALRTVGVRQTDSFLLVLAEMVKHEVLRAAVRKEVAARRLPVAGWLLRLKNLRPVRAGRMVDAWGDASNIVIETDFPTRQPLSLIALVDGTVGTSLKDAFLGPVTVNEFLARASADPDERDDQIVTELVSLADARAWLEAGIENGDHAFPPFETDTWPGIRPVVEWMLRLMPEGGQAPGWSELTEARREAVQNAFAGSPHAACLPAAHRDDAADIAGLLMDFTASLGDGDPLIWSPLRVEIFFKDWILRKVVADAAYLRAVPPVLRAFIQFADAERDFPGHLTRHTVDEVGVQEKDFLRQIGSRPSSTSGPLGNVDLTGHDLGGNSLLDVLTRMGVDVENDPEAQRLLALQAALATVADLDLRARDEIVAALGGEDALASVNGEPLPDEPLILDGVASDVVDRVRAIDALMVTVGTSLSGIELRTSARRLLRRLALAEPKLFRGTAKDANSAASILWITGHINSMFRSVTEGFTVRALTDALEITAAPSTRAKVFLRALGVKDIQDWMGFPRLGDPSLLIGEERERLLSDLQVIEDEMDDDDPWDEDNSW
ncbi:hypothetical protein [Salana multivorans]